MFLINKTARKKVFRLDKTHPVEFSVSYMMQKKAARTHAAKPCMDLNLR
jgi:hypothetical protein